MFPRFSHPKGMCQTKKVRHRQRSDNTMECVSSIQTCNGARGGEATGSGTDLGSIAAKLCHVHRTSGSNEVVVACVTKDNALLCWEGSGSNVILSVHLPSLDKSSFKSSASMKGIQMYDRSEDRRGGGSEVALLTDTT